MSAMFRGGEIRLSCGDHECRPQPEKMKMSTVAVAQPTDDARSEAEVRIDLAAAYRLCAHFAMDDLIYTHLSARVPGEPGHFLLNPYGEMFEEITASSIIKVDLDGNVVDAASDDLNAFGHLIHGAFYKARPEVGAVMHTHTRAGIAIAALQGGLLPMSQMSMHFYKSISYHDYEGPVLNPAEQDTLVANMGENRAMMLRNHGLLTIGESVAEAFSRLYYLEQCCRSQVDAMSTGDRVIIPPPEVCGQTNEYYRQGPYGPRMPFSRREWPALLRMLDKRDASYRD